MNGPPPDHEHAELHLVRPGAHGDTLEFLAGEYGRLADDLVSWVAEGWQIDDWGVCPCCGGTVYLLARCHVLGEPGSTG